ncbi:hypothetical protein GGE45_000996 [Rhizobium aethiopicum]|uniref:Uncharacterized protein n=1 Tax=Rhizobium aethiopicum TaxID=1138170 RepID=A0A7W6MFA9_9HYPH|nr:hypothetical protein [Rhizobium aethiopicum]MBB4191467.1 hypothetical protein [Rhizobium aethiopicum]MBB4578682.1 hypothetical protein [Rhizobium aethiopicum]
MRRMIRIFSLLLFFCLPFGATGLASAQSTASAAGLGPRLDEAASDPALCGGLDRSAGRENRRSFNS